MFNCQWPCKVAIAWNLPSSHPPQLEIWSSILSQWRSENRWSEIPFWSEPSIHYSFKLIRPSIWLDSHRTFVERKCQGLWSNADRWLETPLQNMKPRPISDIRHVTCYVAWIKLWIPFWPWHSDDHWSGRSDESKPSKENIDWNPHRIK